MSKIIATFDGLQIRIEGAEKVTPHQLWIASRYLNSAYSERRHINGEDTIAEIHFCGFAPALYVTASIEHEHLLALAAEFAMAAQAIFSNQQIQAVVQATVQMTLRAIAQQAEDQQIMARVSKSGLVIPNH
ncbi:MAG: hypothetical protein GY832_26285 [Chloroflexi bacterium]|nr:hypothetical protein [Chloroflexota bacterium]